MAIFRPQGLLRLRTNQWRFLRRLRHNQEQLPVPALPELGIVLRDLGLILLPMWRRFLWTSMSIFPSAWVKQWVFLISSASTLPVVPLHWLHTYHVWCDIVPQQYYAVLKRIFIYKNNTTPFLPIWYSCHLSYSNFRTGSLELCQRLLPNSTQARRHKQIPCNIRPRRRGFVEQAQHRN